MPEDQTSSGEWSLDYKGDRASYYAGFFWVDTPVIGQLIEDLESAGAAEVVATMWYDTVGEEVRFIRRDGKLLQFESEADMEQFLRDSPGTTPAVEIDWGKTNSDDTILVRLRVKAKTKRAKIKALFAEALDIESDEDHAQFTQGFGTLAKSDTHDFVWCKFKWKDRSDWYEASSHDVISALVDVSEAGEFLYFAFDIDKLDLSTPFKLDDSFYYVLMGLDGATKIWIKIRRRNGDGLYTYFPGMGDESYFLEKYIPDDNEWPQY